MRYVKSLDTIRAFAIIIVIISHWSPENPVKKIFIPAGDFGVTLFFVLSGYLITSILLAAKATGQSKLHIIKNFIIRRCLRIFPVYYLLIIILILLDFPFGKNHLIYILTYTSNFLVIKERTWNSFSHTWSLSIEEQFYLIWPWLILFIRDKYLKYLFISSVLISIISVFIYVRVLQVHFYPVFTSCCFDAFGIGAAYAYARLKEDRLQKLLKYLRVALPVALLIYFTERISRSLGIRLPIISFERTIDSVICLWIIHGAVSSKNLWIKKNVLENKFLNLIGKISYGIYLFHYPLPFFFNKGISKLQIVFPSLQNILGNVFFDKILMSILLFILSYLSFEFFEKRITNLKNRLGLKGTDNKALQPKKTVMSLISP
jgi:peptidoglycan/LPS O-acetylase OafA/YrhL